MTLQTCLSRLAVSLLVAGVALPSQAVTGRLHINGGSSFQTTGLVPDKTFTFHDGDPSQSLSFQQSFNGGQPPQIVYGRLANAMMTGSDGVLGAYVDAELNGIPPRSDQGLGIYVEAKLNGLDYFTVKSNTLPVGTLTQLSFDLDVLGNGRAFADYKVAEIFTNGGQANRLTLSYNDPGTGLVTATTHGSFMAKVGTSYSIEYSLLVSGGLSIFGLSSANPVKYIVSDYFHTMHVYAQPDAPNVALQTLSGHDYAQLVPEPASALLLLAGLGMTAWGRRRCASRGA